MRTDAVVLGAELDALVAALRLLEMGHSVRMFAPGAGSLHFSPGGIHFLRSPPDDGHDPLDRLSALDTRHPYRIVGGERVRAALDWFFDTTGDMGFPLSRNGANVDALSPAGVALPVYGAPRRLATLPALRGRMVAIVRFRGHRDFPAALVASSLRSADARATIVDVEPPARGRDSVALARGFDELHDVDAFFAAVAARLPAGTEAVVLPAVLGLQRSDRTACSAESTMGLPCLEVPTLPPSVWGLRLHCALTERLNARGALVHLGARGRGLGGEHGQWTGVEDEAGRAFEASAFVVATGGVLMGGLEVDSRGRVHETTFGLEVVQTRPLEAATPAGVLDALHRTGVDTDESLRPRSPGTGGNLFVTGRTLAHWNPATEGSAEGVSIATGWSAAGAIHEYLRS